MSALWQGHWTTKARIASGLVLFTYVLFHLLNIGLGLFSLELMEQAQDWRKVVTRSALGGVILYAALLMHAGLAFGRLAKRRTLRMPLWEAAQIILGLIIPLLLMAHFVHTRVAFQQFGVNDRMGYISGLIWNTSSGRNQAILLLIVWCHGCIGLHFWLRLQAWWRRSLPLMISLGTLIPAFALAGFMVQGRIQRARLFDPETSEELATLYNFPSAESLAALLDITEFGLSLYWGILAVVLLVWALRRWGRASKSLKIQFVDGPEISGRKGMTLLEMSRASGVPHMALCGGRGRCTTCRVIIEEGKDLLHPPSEEEKRALEAVNAPPNARLACQIHPTAPATVLRVFHPDGQLARSHESLGQEKRLAILFLDMRGFTARTTGQLPYDVVFLLNRFFDAVVPSITGAGGTVDKYLGDGLLAVFELETEQASAQAAMNAAKGIGSALETFNKTLAAEKADQVAIGIGLHLGDLVLGEIGAAENAPRTIIGATVNTASRLEAETKALGVELLVSKETLNAANVDCEHLELRTLTLRGVLQPVEALAIERASTLDAALTPAIQT
ncbi:adenylate/guanylate cyclase domain-containing protein [Shimia thalassica]|uniref:adenylate/guanylate cyclase domain-containing protein n=1 Tax=Shimia thalassica TaxID=1715693 RepID=UPI001C0883EC|nr:adenylate/guanylate cyclase domain-containing protein [Shimia thalassica]MBU2942740.1 adenylate/guanylate cyclase domain-containing protein [Shimia thalassica]MDO6502492.1 adenylate/guanylate cyclase domain-containing protein [Shimia thalassica]